VPREALYSPVIDALLAIETREPCDQGSRESLSLSLPSSQTFSSLWSRAQRFVALPQGYLITVSTTVQARHIAACLLVVLNDVSHDLLSSTPHALTDQFILTVDCCRRLASSCTAVSLEQFAKLIPTLNILCDIAINMTTTLTATGASQSLLELSAKLVSFATVFRDTGYERRTARLLLVLLDKGANSTGFRVWMNEKLTPMTMEFVRDEIRFSKWSKPLQVCKFRF